jgi:hypothetical protein
MADMETTKKRLMRVLTKKPLRAVELAEKLESNHPDQGYDDARSFGRSLGALVKEGKVIKAGAKSRPTYTKV